MKTCALCTRATSPKNGVTTSPDAVLCHLCLAQYELTPEYRREQYFKKEGNEGAARVALTDYVTEYLKIRQVEREAETRVMAEKVDAEKRAAEAAKTPVPTKNGVREGS